MQIIYHSSSSSVCFPPSVATVGFFDGLHAGHRALINELKTLAALSSQKSILFTFATHPRQVLNPDFQPDLLTTLSEKLKQLETTGIDVCVVLEFNAAMAKLSAFDFIKTILKEQYNVNTLLIGHDHRFGHNRNDGFDEYQQFGKELNVNVIQAKRFTTATDSKISSSHIRLALLNGDIEQSNRLLTYSYSIQGKVVEGFKMGRKIGYPTANIEIENKNKIIPTRGVYAVRVYWNKQSYKGMLNIGFRPTLNNGKNISIEVHLFDFNQDIYAETIELEFIQKIRDEVKFDGLDKLIEQLGKDELTARQILNDES